MANETIEEQRERDYQFHLDIAERIAPTWEKRRAEGRGVRDAGPRMDAIDRGGYELPCVALCAVAS
jgi:hypothetical protein